MLIQKAELLRTRLQLAEYKVQTNQTRTPFFWLRGLQDSPEPLSTPPVKSEEEKISAARNQERSPVQNPSSPHGRATEEEVGTSVAKEEAANGLLDLIRAAAGS
jgi:Whi5 like